MIDAESPFCVTADEGLRGKKVIKLKDICDQAMDMAPCVKTCFVYKRTGGPVTMKEGRDVCRREGCVDAPLLPLRADAI
jgi:acetyl-CoA synthetase